jgi:heme oxygenase
MISDASVLMDRLRTGLEEWQSQVAALPFFRALAANDLPPESYVGLLNALSLVYTTLEQQAIATEQPHVTSAWQEYTPRLPLLQRDLAYFEASNLPEMPTATLHALLLADQMRRDIIDTPVALLGYLLVLDAPLRLGSAVRALLGRVLRLKDRDGLAYVASYETPLADRWEGLRRQLAEAPLGPVELRQIHEATRHAMARIQQIVQSLYPIPDSELSALVAVLNHEAGAHAIADDPREIAAALRAGDRSWRRLPYYEWRYGERGRRFSWSDSSWLVTLSIHTEAVVTHQIDWLSRVLAARGMPRWLLEQHLQTLHEELLGAVPEKSRQYAILAYQADRLRDLRHQQIDEPTFQTLSADFDAAAGLEWSARLPHTGYLLVAAVADERAGVKRVVTSLERGLTDPQQFPQHWIDAVHGLIDRARRYPA